MNCLFCKSELKTEYTNYIAALGKCMIVIRNVPTQVCTQCGEKSYSFEVSVRILVSGLSMERRPLHTVSGYDDSIIYAVTAYHPNIEEWEHDFKTRRVKE